MIVCIHVSQEIFEIDVLTALKFSLEHRRKQVMRLLLRLLQLYGDQAIITPIILTESLVHG